MIVLLSKSELVKLSETLFSLGYEIEAVKTIDESLSAGNPGGYFRGIDLIISRRFNIANFFSKPLSKDSLLKLAEAIASFNYGINSLKIVREPGFRGIHLRIARLDS